MWGADASRPMECGGGSDVLRAMECGGPGAPRVR